MVATVGSISVDLTTNAAKFSAGFKSAATTVERESSRMAKSVGNIERSFSNLATGLRTIAGGAAIREVTQFADAWTTAGNKIRAASEISGIEARNLTELNVIADRSRAGMAQTVDLYSKLILSATNLKATEQQVAQVTETLGKAFKAGGAGAQQAEAGIIQLTQALASGVLQGDELRSLREFAPVVAQAIATEFGTTIGGLKALGAEGALTADRVFRAIINAQNDVEAAFDKTTPTIADALTKFQNALIKTVANLDQATGGSKRLITEIDNLGGAIERFANDPSFEKFLSIGEVKIVKGGLVDTLLQGINNTGIGFNSGEVKLIEQTTTLATAKIEGARRKLMEFELEVGRTNDLELDLDTSLAVDAIEEASTALSALKAQASEEFKINFDRAALAQAFRAAENASMEGASSGDLPTVHSFAGIENAVNKNTESTAAGLSRVEGAVGSSGGGGGGGLKPLQYSVPKGGGYAEGDAADSFKFSGLGSSSSWGGKRMSFSTGTPDPSRMGQALRSNVMDRLNYGWKPEGASSISGGGGAPATNVVNIVVKPILTGGRLSEPSRAEIKQAAAAGTNAALRAYNGR